MNHDRPPEANADLSHASGVIIGDHATMHNTYYPRARHDSVHVDLGNLADRLAIAVRRQWSAEANWRQLSDPYAIPVRWEPADAALVAGWQTLVTLASSGPGWPVSGADSWARGPAELAGTGNDLVDVLGRIPTGRLVVLGEPGAGKTILLVRLVLDLLARRGPGQPVPVLFSLASWDPEREDLYTWIERTVTTGNPALAAVLTGGPRVSRARALLESGLFLLVLDGLDEMPPGLRGTAIARINDALRPGQRLVLAARSEAFRQAVRPLGGPEVVLAGTAGIDLCPLRAGVVIDYLRHSAGGPDSAARWDEVVATLAADPHAPVARALTTPLMAAMARAVYNPRPGENLSSVARHPAELLDQAAFPARTAIEHHLFDAFIPAAYRFHPDRSRNGRWTTEQATRWLTFLARDMEHRQHGTTDLAWWQLRGAAPTPLAGLSVGLLTGIPGGLTIPWPGWGIGTISAVAVGLVIRRRPHSGTTSLAKGLTGGMLGGQLAALVALVVFGAGVGNTNAGAFVAGGLSAALVLAPMGRFSAGVVGAFVGALVNAVYERAPALAGVRLPAGSGGIRVVDGIALGLVAGLAAGLFYRRTPARGLRWSALGFVGGSICGLLFGSIMWVTAGRSIGLVMGATAIVVGGVVGGLYAAPAPMDLARATAPLAVLARDRATFLVILTLAVPAGLALALGAALSPPDPFLGPYHGLDYGVGVGIAEMIAIGLGLAFLQASWGGFTLARCWLAASGRLPLRLLAFLDDAHVNRGVLRQVGAVYQFRHAELQRRLAGRP